MAVKILSERTINRIAAGEVVERPASVVKELVENALDAGSSKITVKILGGGFSRITVSDNGYGMSKQDLALAVQRHATSKLDEDDIHNINSFGFRGEALPSIGSVSRMVITSCQVGQTKGASVTVQDSEISEVTIAGGTHGTVIEVSNLFANIPAKLKFAKTARAETMACTDFIERFALAYPQVKFTMYVDDRPPITYNQSAADNLEAQLSERAGQVISKDFVANSRWFHVKLDSTLLYGRAALPTFNSGNQHSLYVYVNKRLVKDKLLASCIRQAYRGLAPEGRYPIVALFIEIDPREIDVNVHPMKFEIRFRDEARIRNLIASAIRDVMRRIDMPDRPDVAPHAAPAYSQPAPAANYNWQAASRPIAGGIRESSWQGNLAPVAEKQQMALPDHVVEEGEPAHGPLGTAICQVALTYIVAQNAQGVVIVDQHAAHERITLERMKQANNKQGVKTQHLLMPLIIELGVAATNLILQHTESLNKLGILVDPNGDSQIAVRSIPVLLDSLAVKALISDLVASIKSEENAPVGDEYFEECLADIACRHSIRAGQKLNIGQMNYLLRSMEATEFVGQCNHGRPTYIQLSEKELAKMFERT